MITEKVKSKLLKETIKYYLSDAEYFVRNLQSSSIETDKSKIFNEDVLDGDDRDYDELVEVYHSYDNDSKEFTIEFNCGSNYLEMVFTELDYSYNFTSDSGKSFNSGITKDDIYGEIVDKIPYDRKRLDKLVAIVNVIDQEL